MGGWGPPGGIPSRFAEIGSPSLLYFAEAERSKAELAW